MLDREYPELGVVHIAVPCPMKWSDMQGDARSRHCARCQLQVFDFAELDSEEARQLLRARAEGGRICARLFVRRDGTVLTKNCRGYPLWAPKFTLPPVLLALLALGFLAVGSFLDNYRQLMSMSGQLELRPAPTHAPVRHR